MQVTDIDTDLRTCGGVTPLMSAVLSGREDIVRYCLEQNFNPFLVNSLNQSARDCAQTYLSGNADAVALLID